MDSNLNTDLLDFIRRSPTPFHATENLRALLLDARTPDTCTRC